MPKAKCPKCGAEGECEHVGGGFVYQGIFYDEYSFKCPKCGYGKLHKDGVEFDDPDVLVRIPINHVQNRCPYCSETATKSPSAI